MVHEHLASPLNDEKLIALIKRAILEVLSERREVFREVMEEALEDITLARVADDRKPPEDRNRVRRVA